MKDGDEEFLSIAQVIMSLLNFSIRLLQKNKQKTKRMNNLCSFITMYLNTRE